VGPVVKFKSLIKDTLTDSKSGVLYKLSERMEFQYWFNAAHLLVQPFIMKKAAFPNYISKRICKHMDKLICKYMSSEMKEIKKCIP